MSHVRLRRMCMLLLGRVFCVCILDLGRLLHCLSPVSLISFCLIILSIFISWVLKSPTTVLDLCLSSVPLGFASFVLMVCHSVQFSCSVVSNSLPPHGLQHTWLPCPSPTPGAYSNSCPSSWWCHPTILSSVIPFSSCLQSFPSSGSFQMSHLLETIARMCWRQDLADLYLTKGKQNSPL